MNDTLEPFPAPFADECSERCGDVIYEGDLIVRHPDGVCHAECAA